MDGEAVRDGAVLARTAGREWVFFDASARATRLETGVLREEVGKALGALLDVGLQEDLPAGPHRSK